MFTSLVVLPVKKFIQSNPAATSPSTSSLLLRSPSFSSLPSQLCALSHHFLGSSPKPSAFDPVDNQAPDCLINNHNPNSFQEAKSNGQNEKGGSMKSPPTNKLNPENGIHGNNNHHNHQLNHTRNIHSDVNHINLNNVVNDGIKKKYPSFVKIVEVGPRDGLQAEPVIIPTTIKVNFINLLSQTGLKVIEATSFVHPKMVPQMGDNSTVYNEINKDPAISYPVLVPNLTGLNNAIKVGVQEIAVFAAATDSFSMKNVNCNISKSLDKIQEVVSSATSQGIKVRGYISCCLGCPYDGDVAPEKVAKLARRLYSMGCYEISLGDTIGVGTPHSMRRLLAEVTKHIPTESIAVHCHDTYGQALANILTAIELGVSVVDSSVTGLGGCPFAEGATGNVATEDVLYMLNGMGIKTGVDMDKLLEAGNYICGQLKRDTGSKAGRALLARKRLSLIKSSSNDVKSTRTLRTNPSSKGTTAATDQHVCQSNKPGHKNIN